MTLDNFRQFAVYTRVSSDGQSDGTSPAVQFESGKNYGLSKGWEYVTVCHDSISGGMDYAERPAMAEIIKLLKTRKITDVIFYNVDRAARDLSVIKELYLKIYELGGRVSIASKQRTYESYMAAYDDSLFEGFLAMWQRQKIRQTTESGTIFAFENMSILKQVKTGYKSVPDVRMIHGKAHTLRKPVIDEQGRELVLAIVDAILETGNKTAALTKLNKAGIRTLSGKDIQSHLAQSICDNALMYAGQPVKESIKVDNGTRTLTREMVYPAIIDLETAYKLIKVNKSAIRYKANPNKPLLGVGRCAHCGKSAIVMANDRMRAGYILLCSSKKSAYANNQRLGKKVITTECERSLSITPVKEKIIQYLTQNQNQTESLFRSFEIRLSEKIIYIAKLENKLRSLREESETLEDEIKRLTKVYIGIADNPDASDILRELNSQIKESREQATKILENISQIADEIEDRKNALAVTGIHITDSDITAIQEIIPDGDLRKTVQFDTIKHVFRQIIGNKAAHIQDSISEIVSALHADNWADANRLMREVGVTFTVDFSQADRDERRKGIRVYLSGMDSV